ncbi:RagB/SusD family nutrient uptake outer membrane protein [Lacibacter sp.]|uniref:RagB/SusD family nutrient uptake outer membrane protein n=1 Tax=Lacibacter sp. TaxID=1915409 RepID=UPI002B4B56D8|nr:RagB/SusD family nutrient uptake outer membrane protein [Lacibacter sp.]HLP35911.1 RagB/SusD family nutrient uptake outer membrane protein [Lacibacter sp.]
MLRYKQIKMWMVAVLAVSLVTSCKKNFTDPNRATSDKVFASASGLTGVSIGLQRVYALGRASSLYNVISINGFVTKELRLLNPGNLPEFQLSTGGPTVDGTNTMLAGLWTSSNKIIYDADLVIGNAAGLADKGTASGLIGYASIFKALSIGNMAMFWEQIPAGTGSNVTFITRQNGFLKAVEVIDDALSIINTNAISATFSSKIPAGIDIVSTLNALKARYLLFAGNYAQALTAANLVDLSKKSTLNFEAANPNPIYDVAGSNFNVYQPIDSTMGLLGSLQPDLADKRVPFYMVLSGSSASRFLMKGFAAATTTAYPIYYPGEITLIKAECYARQGTPDLVNALVELNKVVTKKAADDALGIGADLPLLVGPLTQAQVLDQIYRNRCIELYMSGLKLEDMRRFGRATSERTRNFMPYPFRERDNNPNTPADPAG